MPIPNLIHPIPCVIQRIVPAATTVSQNARAPVRQMWKQGQGPGLPDATEIVAQVNFNEGRIGKPKYSPTGTLEESEGYLLARVVDLLSAGIATENLDGTISFGFVRGDKIVRVGKRATNLYISFFRDVAGYPDQGGLTLLEINFVSRNPKDPERT